MRQHADPSGTTPRQSLSSYRPPAGAGTAVGDDILIASVFRNMRATLGMTQADLAARLATSVPVIAALEDGAIRQLPAWSETVRIVAGYGHLLQMDVQPALARLQLSVRRFGGPAAAPSIPSVSAASSVGSVPLPATARAAQPVHALPPAIPRPPVHRTHEADSRSMPQPAPAPVHGEPAIETPSLRERMGQQLEKLYAMRPRLSIVGGPNVRRAGLALAIVAVAILGVAAMPSKLTAKLDSISPAVAQSLRSSLDRWTTRTVAGDLQWIEVADPRSRKADKLPVAQR